MTRCCAVVVALLVAGLSPVTGAKEESKPAVVILPIPSEEKGLGEKVAFMLRAKAKRLGAITYDPGSVSEALGVRDVTVDTPPAELRKLARERFGADVAVVGRVGGNEKRGYAVRLVAVRAGGDGAPFLDKTYAATHHQVIPIRMAEAVREIMGLPAEGDDPATRAIERRWKEAPNLVANPGFEAKADDRNGPADWQPLEKQMAWEENPDGEGKVLKYDMNRATAATYGLDFYSDWIRIEPGATYRFACRVKTMGPTPKIFLKGYHAFPAAAGFPAQRRETYRRQVHPKGEKGEWQAVVADFVPEATRARHHPTWMKVDLYAYHPAGVVYWDDVVLKKVADAPAESESTDDEEDATDETDAPARAEGNDR